MKFPERWLFPKLSELWSEFVRIGAAARRIAESRMDLSLARTFCSPGPSLLKRPVDGEGDLLPVFSQLLPREDAFKVGRGDPAFLNRAPSVCPEPFSPPPPFPHLKTKEFQDGRPPGGSELVFRLDAPPLFVALAGRLFPPLFLPHLSYLLLALSLFPLISPAASSSLSVSFV